MNIFIVIYLLFIQTSIYLMKFTLLYVFLYCTGHSTGCARHDDLVILHYLNALLYIYFYILAITTMTN